MSGSISDLIDDALTQAQAVWEAVVPADFGNLHDLPQHVAHSLDALLNKLTNNGTLPVPNPRDWLPEQLQPAAPAPLPLPPAPAPSSTALLDHLRAYFSRLASHSREHPWIYASVAVGLSGGASYYCAPHATRRTLEPLSHWLVPLAVLPDPKDRPHRLLPAKHRVAGEVRKEAVVVLGADSPHGSEIALDLERRGFVVVATVADPADIDPLERTSRGWLKVLVLDPKEVSPLSRSQRPLSFPKRSSLVRRAVLVGLALPAIPLDGPLAPLPPPQLRRPLLATRAHPRPHRRRQLPLARLPFVLRPVPARSDRECLCQERGRRTSRDDGRGRQGFVAHPALGSCEAGSSDWSVPLPR